jgi:hypothetical protein
VGRSGDRLKACNETGSKVVVWNIALLCHVTSRVDHLSPATGTSSTPGSFERSPEYHARAPCEKRPANAVHNAMLIGRITRGKVMIPQQG